MDQRRDATDVGGGSDTSNMRSTDAPLLVGRRVRQLRGSRSQADAASAMRDRGFKWSQTTVWKVESGERPLRLDEAFALAEVLSTDVNYLAGRSSDQSDVLAELAHLRRQLAAVREAIA